MSFTAPGVTGGWTPPPAVPLGFVLFASLFDRIAIICFKDTCNHQLEAFPSTVRPKVVLVDSDEVNKRLGIGAVDDHGYKVTQGHGSAWDLLEQDGVASVLILEDDYRVLNSTVAHFVGDGGKPSPTLEGVGKLVRSSSWGMMRLGYNPLLQTPSAANPLECNGNCACVASDETPNVCAVTLPPNLQSKPCDVRSFVGYAVQKSLRPQLLSFAHAAFDNYTNYLGSLEFARSDYRGSKDGLGYISVPQDIFLPQTIERLHYFTPGFVFQDDKSSQVVAMTSFGLTCNADALATPMGQTALTLPAFVLNASTPEAEPSSRRTHASPQHLPAAVPEGKSKARGILPGQAMADRRHARAVPSPAPEQPTDRGQLLGAAADRVLQPARFR